MLRREALKHFCERQQTVVNSRNVKGALFLNRTAVFQNTSGDMHDHRPGA